VDEKIEAIRLRWQGGVEPDFALVHSWRTGEFPWTITSPRLPVCSEKILRGFAMEPRHLTAIAAGCQFNSFHFPRAFRVQCGIFAALYGYD